MLCSNKEKRATIHFSCNMQWVEVSFHCRQLLLIYHGLQQMEHLLDCVLRSDGFHNHSWKHCFHLSSPQKKASQAPPFLVDQFGYDLLVGLFAIPIYIILFTVKTSWLMLLIYDCVDMLTGLSSIFTLAVISLERLYATVLPLRQRQLNLRNYIIAIATPWILSLMVTSTRVLQAFFIITAKQFLIVVIFSLSTPLLISCIAYYIIWKKQASRIHNHVHVRNNAKLSRTLLLITAIFVLSWLPFQVLLIVADLCISCRRFPIFILFVIKLLQYGNSFINFVIYCLRMPDYKNAVSQILRCCKCNRNTNRFSRSQAIHSSGVALVSFTSGLFWYTVSDSTVQDVQ